eukprot:CAMPEP_0184685754 /NCGR_PEP_ID=MMETSP0312-20130426/20077_1 /TAXON_ID=31354 /ORGANISM="Compsopogon coeruleus, Strain SAG 36.94" /LENGTH=170 /DNA_ID=CAMNT_0027140175 /DNA_START=96 /DNA_END=605 /DNA_ORIENTATION=-
MKKGLFRSDGGLGSSMRFRSWGRRKVVEVEMGSLSSMEWNEFVHRGQSNGFFRATIGRHDTFRGEIQGLVGATTSRLSNPVGVTAQGQRDAFLEWSAEAEKARERKGLLRRAWNALRQRSSLAEELRPEFPDLVAEEVEVETEGSLDDGDKENDDHSVGSSSMSDVSTVW